MGACFRTGKSLEKDRSTRHSVSLGFSTDGLSSCSEAFPRGTRHGDTKRADIKYRFAKEKGETYKCGRVETPKPERHCNSSVCIVSF
jgi:hypothetical protein